MFRFFYNYSKLKYIGKKYGYNTNMFKYINSILKHGMNQVESTIFRMESLDAGLVAKNL